MFLVINKEKLNGMKEACKSFNKNDSSKNICALINELIENNQKIREIVQNLGEDYILKTPTILSKYKSDLHNFLNLLFPAPWLS